MQKLRTCRRPPEQNSIFVLSPSRPILINYRLENTRIVSRISESGLGLPHKFTQVPIVHGLEFWTYQQMCSISKTNSICCKYRHLRGANTESMYRKYKICYKGSDYILQIQKSMCFVNISYYFLRIRHYIFFRHRILIFSASNNQIINNYLARS